jgi:ribosomal protein S27AE
MIVLKFETWEEFDNAIAGISTAFYNATLPEEQEEEQECSRCGQWVLPSEHGSFGCGGGR